jgi:hypothetical protein
VGFWDSDYATYGVIAAATLGLAKYLRKKNDPSRLGAPRSTKKRGRKHPARSRGKSTRRSKLPEDHQGSVDHFHRIFDIAARAAETGSPLLLQVGEQLICAGQQRTIVERREFLAHQRQWVELTLESPGNRLVIEIPPPSEGREAIAWRRLGSSMDDEKVFASSITVDGSTFEPTEKGEADVFDSTRQSDVRSCQYRLFTVGGRQLKCVRIMHRSKSDWRAQLTSDLDVSDLRSSSVEFIPCTYHLDSSSHLEIARLIDSIPQVVDLTSPMRANVGDRVTWKNDEYVVALRSDCVEQLHRWPRLVARSSVRECRFELTDGPHGVEAREWHRLNPDVIDVERMMRAWITVDGVSHEYERSSKLSFRTVASGPGVVAGSLEVRSFRLQNQWVSCERSVESGEIEWLVSYPDDVGQIELVNKWSGKRSADGC